MISKRVTILLAVSALALTACGKENTAVDASIDFAKSESVAQNLQQAMADMTSAAAETKEEINTKVETEIAALPEVETVDTLDADDLMGTWLMVGGEIEGDVWEAIPGNVFYYDRTDGVSYVDVYSESGIRYRIEIDTTGEQTLINGLSVEECFDGVTKIW